VGILSPAVGSVRLGVRIQGKLGRRRDTSFFRDSTELQAEALKLEDGLSEPVA
jgi:hypothetical protein